jgi:hypothetical protein
LLDRFDVIDIGDFWRLWPLIVMYFGLTQLVTPRGRRRSAWLLLIGIWLLVSSVEAFGFHYGNSWPLLIMFVGLSMVFDHRFGRRHESTPHHGGTPSEDA